MMDPRNKMMANLEELRAACRKVKMRGEHISLTSGCFDLLHGGHLEYLCQAARYGHLVVGINSDAFVKKLKGEDRPIRSEEDRAFVMAGFYSVRLVVVFEDDYELIKAVSPDYYIASSTSHVSIWDDKRRVELLKSLDSHLIELGSEKTDSTTSIIKRAKIAA